MNIINLTFFLALGLSVHETSEGVTHGDSNVGAVTRFLQAIVLFQQGFARPEESIVNLYIFLHQLLSFNDLFYTLQSNGKYANKMCFTKYFL